MHMYMHTHQNTSEYEACIQYYRWNFTACRKVWNFVVVFMHIQVDMCYIGGTYMYMLHDYQVHNLHIQVL